MSHIRCPHCRLLVEVEGVSPLSVAAIGNHEPTLLDGLAMPSETPACPGSEMLGYVESGDRLWVRVGDASNYLQFGDDLPALVEHLNELHVGRWDHWREGGLETVNHRGHDYISLYWGDTEGNLVHSLDVGERQFVVNHLE